MFGNNNQMGAKLTRDDLGPSLINFGLAMLANNNGRMNDAQLIGQSGLDALSALKARRDYEIAMQRQEAQDERATQEHAMNLEKWQAEKDEAAYKRKLQERFAGGDMRALAMLDPEAYSKWLTEGRKLAVGTPASFDDTNALGKRYVSESGEYIKMGDAMGRMLAATETASPAGDLALIFNYMKVLDPGSTVREGEFATAQNAGGIDAKTMNLYNRVVSGERLTPKQRKDFLGSASRIFKSMMPTQRLRNEKYTELATKYRMDPALVVMDLYSGIPDAVDRYLASIVDAPTPPPASGIPGVASPAPSHGGQKVWKWNAEKGELE